MKKVLFILFLFFSHCTDDTSLGGSDEMLASDTTSCHKQLYTITFRDADNNLSFESSTFDAVEKIASFKCLNILIDDNDFNHSLKNLTIIPPQSDLSVTYIKVQIADKDILDTAKPIFIIDPSTFEVQGFIPDSTAKKPFYYYFENAQVKEIDSIKKAKTISLGYENTYTEKNLTAPEKLIIDANSLKNALEKIGQYSGKDPSKIKESLVIAFLFTVEALKFEKLTQDIEDTLKTRKSIAWKVIYDQYISQWDDISKKYYQNNKTLAMQNAFILKGQDAVLLSDDKNNPTLGRPQKKETPHFYSETNPNPNKNDTLNKKPRPSKSTSPDPPSEDI